MKQNIETEQKKLMKTQSQFFEKTKKIRQTSQKGTSEKTEIIKIDEDITTNILEVKRIKEKSIDN